METQDAGARDAATPLTYNLDDFLAGYRLKWRPGIWRLLALSVFVVAVYAAIPFLFEGAALRLAVMAGVLVEIALVFAFARFVILPAIVRREFARYPRVRDEFRLALTPQGVSLWTRNSYVESRWSDFIGWRANEKALILYSSPKIFNLFPARLEALGFPLRELRAEVERHVPRKR